MKMFLMIYFSLAAVVTLTGFFVDDSIRLITDLVGCFLAVFVAAAIQRMVSIHNSSE